MRRKGAGTSAWRTPVWTHAQRWRFTLYCQVLCNSRLPASTLTLDWPSSLLPLPPAAGHRRHVRIAHLLKVVSRQGRSEPAAAVKNQLAILVGHAFLDVTLEDTAAHVLSARDVARGPLALLANVDHPRRPRVEFPAGLVDTYLADTPLGVLDQPKERGRMLHRPAGTRLPVSWRSPRCALRRATSSAVATAAADNAVHAKACGQFPSLRQGFSGGSSPCHFRHPVSIPRSTSLPATIAAPAPTSNQVARRGFILFFFTVTPVELDGSEWQAGCRRYHQPSRFLNEVICATWCRPCHA